MIEYETKSTAVHKRQKEIYDRKVHGEPYSVNNRIWLFNPAVEKESQKSLTILGLVHTQLLRKFQCDYRNSQKNPIIVDFILTRQG